MGLEVCRKLSVPACLLFNESPHLDSVLDAVDQGFNLVMFSDEEMELPALRDRSQNGVREGPSRGRGRGSGNGLAAGHGRATDRTARPICD